jgi:hypothetical protein
MRGPKHVDDILRDLHRDAFPGGSAHHSKNATAFDSTRIEVVSNASDSDISELPDVSSLSKDGLNERGLGGRPRRRRAGA